MRKGWRFDAENGRSCWREASRVAMETKCREAEVQLRTYVKGSYVQCRLRGSAMKRRRIDGTRRLVARVEELLLVAMQ